MNRSHAGARYTTREVQDNEEGWIGLELLRHSSPETEVVARLLFWDADGQFSLEMKVSELPVTIVEELIAEAREAVSYA